MLAGFPEKAVAPLAVRFTSMYAYVETGDVCAAKDGKTLYTNAGPPPNSTDTSGCTDPSPTGTGKYFHPTEEHGITIQEGPDGNTDSMPTCVQLIHLMMQLPWLRNDVSLEF
jgi:hypothetical protein